MQSFLDQPGLPLISASLSCAGGVAKLNLSQTRYLPMGTGTEATEVYKVPVCLRYPGTKAEVRLCKLLDRKQARIGSPNAVLVPRPGKSSCAPEPELATAEDILPPTGADL